MKEVDAFCKEYGITYYCAGGTVIGAARHHGFIPWDDDIDIYMTRENFAKFAEMLKEHGPEGRSLEYYEGNHERQAAVARYHKDDDTMFCHFNMLGHSSAGTSLDVFILDPIPNDYEERVDYLAKLYAYSDLISPCHVYSHRLPVSKFDVYEKYKKIADEEGRPRAVELISDEIFHYDAKKCRDYTLRWGSISLIYPVEVIGEPSYLPFEDMTIPVPHDWYRYLVIHFGTDWYNLPYEETQHEHYNIVRYDMQYEYFYKKRDELYTQDYLLDLHFRWKDSERDFFRTADPMKTFAMETQNAICRANIDKNIANVTGDNDAAPSDSVAALFDAERYSDIIKIYEPYIRMQTSHAYMGRHIRHGLQFRWNFPFICPLPDAELRCLLLSMIRTGDQRTAERLLGVFDRANLSTPAIKEAAEVIDLINLGNKLYYQGEYSRSLDLISRSAECEKTPALTDLIYLCEVQTGISKERASELEKLYSIEKPREAVRKAMGDLLWAEGKKKEAEKIYRDLMKESRNGLFWMDIKSKVPDIAPIPTKRLTPFTDTSLTKMQRQLLEEIAGICDRNGIRYVVGPDLARRMHLTSNIGYVNSNRELFMDAENAQKFIDAFGAEERPGRKLMSWKNGDPVRDFALIYSGTENVYCDFRRLGQWRNMGIFITIRILRENSASKMQKRKALIDEFYLNIANIEGIDKRNLQSASKKLLYATVRLRSENGRKRLSEAVFDNNIRSEASLENGKEKTDFYYYTNVRGMKPVRHIFARSLWEETATAEVNGVNYTIPKAMTAKYVKKETDLANVAPIDSIFIYRSDEMSWDEISPLIDDSAYEALDWEGYAKTRRKFRKLDQEVWHDWWMILKLGEELDVNEKASDTVAAYRSAKAAGDETAAAAAMSEVDALVRKYEALGVPIDLTSELKDCYDDYLKRYK